MAQNNYSSDYEDSKMLQSQNVENTQGGASDSTNTANTTNAEKEISTPLAVLINLLLGALWIGFVCLAIYIVIYILTLIGKFLAQVYFYYPP